MSLSSWLRRLTEDYAGPCEGRSRPRTTFLALEVLEDRLVPATLTVNTLADTITDTSHLSLRDAIALVNFNGNPGSLNQLSMPSGWSSQITGTFGQNDTIQFDPALAR